MKRNQMLRAVATALVLIGSAGEVSAQSAPAKEPRWEIVVLAGGSVIGASRGGVASLPPAGERVDVGTFSSGGQSWSPYTRIVPSWYFGDGGALAAEANSTWSGTTRQTISSVPLEPIDRILTSSGAKRGHAGTVGVRLSRPAGARLRLELGVELSDTGIQLTRDALDLIERSRSSFEGYWRNVGGYFSNDPEVWSLASVVHGNTRGILATAAVELPVGRQFYATVGAGAVLPTGADSRVTLAGRYRFDGSRLFPGLTPWVVDESDTVEVRFGARPRPVVVLGGGWRRPLGDRWGLHVNARVLAGSPGLRTTIQATPGRQFSSGSDITTLSTFARTETSAVLLFTPFTTSRGPASLSAVPLDTFTTFSSRGFQMRLSLTTGLSIRF